MSGLLAFRRNFENLHAVVIANLEVHRALSQLPSNFNHRLLRLPEQSVIAAHRNSATFVSIKRTVLRIEPLALGDPFIGTAAKLQGQLVQDSADLLGGHFPAVIEAHGEQGGELHLRTRRYARRRARPLAERNPGNTVPRIYAP